MKTRTIFVLMFAIVLALCLAIPKPAAAASDEEEILKVSQTYVKAMNEADLNLMSTLWLQSSETSMFGPAKDGAFLTSGYEGIVSLFKLLKMPAEMLALSSYNTQVTMLSDKVALVTEYSVLTGNPPDTEEQIVIQMRGSVVLEKVNGKWLIVHAHWSDLPTE